MSMIDVEIKAEIGVGSRVRAIAPTDGNGEIVGKEGTVLSVATKGRYAVEFDTPSYLGHCCDERCKDRYGWWCKPETLELI